jgi:multiple sugar transport system substrate-binding protein
MTKRYCSVAILGATVAMALSMGCFADDAKTEITFWNGFTGGDRPTLEALVKEYNETNDKNIQVNMDIMPWDSLYQKLSTTLAVGQGPDIVAMAPERMGAYAQSGAFMPLDDAWEDGTIDADAVPEALKESLVYDGSYYGVPMDYATLLLFYNKDIFKEAGLDPESPPTTWDELEADAQQIVDKTDKYGFTMALKDTTPMWCIMVWGNGGDYIVDGKPVLNSEENIETITRWAEDIRDKGFGPADLTGGDIDKLFQSQKLAMYFCGPWAATGFTADGINFGIAQAPKGPKSQVTQGNGTGLYRTTSSAEDHKEAVYDFFKWWNSKEAQTEWCVNTGFAPTRTDISLDSLSENPFVGEFSKPLNESKMYLQNLTNFADIDTQVIIPAFEKILLQGEDVKATLDEANEALGMMLNQ